MTARITPALADQLAELCRNFAGDVHIVCEGLDYNADPPRPTLTVCLIPSSAQPSSPIPELGEITQPLLVMLDGKHAPVSLRHAAEDPSAIYKMLEGVLSLLPPKPRDSSAH